MAVNAALIVLMQFALYDVSPALRREGVIVASAVVTAVGFGLTALAATGWQFAATVVVWTIGK